MCELQEGQNSRQGVQQSVVSLEYGLPGSNARVKPNLITTLCDTYPCSYSDKGVAK